MALALEIAFAAAIGVVALSFLAVVTGRASDRLLLIVTIALAVGAAIGVIALGIDLVASYGDTDALIDTVTPGVVDWMQMNTIGAAIQRAVTASDALQRYAMDIWAATSDRIASCPRHSASSISSSETSLAPASTMTMASSEPAITRSRRLVSSWA